MQPIYKTLTLPFLLLTSFVEAQDQQGYNIFNPTPREAMREFSIDRPDITESPISVDPGHFQFEGDLVKFAAEDQGDGYATVTYLNGLYKIGLNHSWDLQLGYELYNVNYDPDGNKIDQGTGNFTVRLKHNFWGNDGDSKTAFGIIPYVTFLKGSTRKLYGAGFPFSVDLTENLGLGAQAQFDFLPSETGDSEDNKLSYFQTVVLGGKLIGNLDFYVEGMIIFFEGERFVAANGGFIYNVTDNVKVDLATNVGMTQGTPSRAYLGLSFRI
jgi:hypothetical protein